MIGGICIPVCAATAAELQERVRIAATEADVVEIRFDCLDPGEIAAALDNLPEIPARYLFTYRPREQGGYRDISMRERVAFWVNVMHRDGDFLIDIEGNELELIKATEAFPRRIVSLHDFDGMWRHADEVFGELATHDGIVKMAATASDTHEALDVWKVLATARAAGRDAVPIAMGEAGKWTRILSIAHGTFLTYASSSSGAETAPGQVTAAELRSLYRAPDLTSETKVFGITGDPVSQSLSRFMHNRAFGSLGFDGVFIPFLVKDIDAFMTRMVRLETREVELNFGGFSVTMPHKQSIMKHLDELDPNAKRIGAVNTVKIENGRLTGYNTDAHGFITPLKVLYGNLSSARVAVFGAGGASRACIFALQEEGADVIVFARDPQKAVALGGEFGVKINRPEDFASRDFDILVNATPVGMSGDTSLFTRDELGGLKFVYDLVTKPFDTPLVAAAKAAGVQAVGGVEMLIAQGAKQFELWTGLPAPVAVMRDSLEKRFQELMQ